MNETVKTSLVVMFYSLLTGICMALFTQIEGFVKFLFSLLALYIGIRYFRRFETVGMRVLYIVLALVFTFITILSFVVYTFQQQNPELFQ
ncbi:hypothetical protein D3P07_00095 [Paenibacillus sp. 1011MAR3C5]|uniref:hypothetical protein n=1 Tax=Paenibacillus sp. 1011MAR3C5 TaxID=1675787 RepID=UPI000E6CA52F|nr:hypothetical protein [Paenibacillus sp. 1011MAR3C5]RJE90550.1 hypothetical protein D3P07_00095 [Paenibacillus sp. 1011MAR3C5]